MILPQRDPEPYADETFSYRAPCMRRDLSEEWLAEGRADGLGAGDYAARLALVLKSLDR